MSLSSIQSVMHDVLRGQRSVDEAAELLGVHPARLAIYRRFVRRHVHTALSAEFPLLATWLGEDGWSELFELYYLAHPPKDPTLPEAAVHLPALVSTLSAEDRLGLTPAHVALAEFEWALYEVSIDGTPLPDPDTLDGPIINPTLALLSFPYDVASLAGALQAGERPESPEPDETLVLAFQSLPRRVAHWHRGRDPLLFALKVVHEGLSAEAAAQISGQPLEQVTAVLEEASQLGLILG
ncbi:MAG: putative DNA-binding domain-containing protein [Bradymonadia bacterium]